MSLGNFKPGRDWTLFLDRDGVINRRIIGGYVTSWETFEFLPGTFEAMRKFSSLFGKIIVVSNQQGVGKGLMSNDDVDRIHSSMIRQVEGAGGRIDRALYAPELSTEATERRKPSIGMAKEAKLLFPAILFEKSIMAGDSVSDMEFGRNAGMVNVLICSDEEKANEHKDLHDFWFPDLMTFAANL